MATCPDCGGFLGERHECPPAWLHYVRFGRSLVPSAVLGAVVGGAVLLLVHGQVTWLTIALMAVIGVLIHLALI